MDESKSPIHIKSRSAEHRVAEYLRAMGRDGVLVGKGTCGPDVTYRLHGREVRVEVKTVQVRRKAGSCVVREVYHTRLNDHLIAIVFPDGQIRIERMKEHLRRCRKSGSRTVTELVNQYCPETLVGLGA